MADSLSWAPWRSAECSRHARPARTFPSLHPARGPQADHDPCRDWAVNDERNPGAHFNPTRRDVPVRPHTPTEANALTGAKQRLQPDERCPNTPAMDAGVTDHVWKIDGSVALLDRR